MSDDDTTPFRVISRAVDLPPRPRPIADGIKVTPDSDLDVALRDAQAYADAAATAGVASMPGKLADLNQAWCAEVQALHEQLARVLGYEIDQGEELPPWTELLRVAEANTDLAFHTRLVHELAREQTEEF